MRIAIVGNFGLSYKATMAARALPLAQELALRGHVVGMFLPADPGSPPVDGIGDEVYLTSLGPPLAGAGGGRLHLAVQRLGLGLRLTWCALRFRPDVLYAFKPKAYAGLALLIFWGLRRLGLIRARLALDTDDWEGAGGWADREHSSRWVRAFVTAHESWCLAHADVVTAASRELARLTASRGGRATYLPNAAAPTSPGWSPGHRRRLRDQRALGDRPVILAYTRFVEFAPERLLEVFARIVAAIPSACLLVAGKGLHGEEADFQTLADERGLAGSIQQLGWTPRESLPDVFAAADLALYPLDNTLLNRTKCIMKLVDLLLAGVPVVADEVGQASEYLANGEIGILTRPEDPAAMAEAAISLLTDPVRRRALGQAARQRILADWTWRDQAARVESVLADQ